MQYLPLSPNNKRACRNVALPVCTAHSVSELARTITEVKAKPVYSPSELEQRPEGYGWDRVEAIQPGVPDRALDD